MVDVHDVLSLITLLKMQLSSEEKEEISHNLSEIIGMITVLDPLPLDHVEPITHPAALSLRCRTDVVQDDAYHHPFVETSPRFQDGFFMIPPVLDHE